MASYSTAVNDDRLQVVIDAIDSGPGGGLVNIYNAGLVTLLSQVVLSKPCATVLGSVLVFAGLPKIDISANATGVAAEANVTNSDGTVVISGLTVGTLGTNIIISDVNIVQGDVVTFVAGSIAVGNPGININMADFATVAEVQATAILADQDFLTTAGYYAAGDGGGALYYRVAVEPLYVGKIQSLDGAWWWLAKQTLWVGMVGSLGGSNDETVMVQGALNLAALWGATTVYLQPAGRRRILSDLTIPVNTTLTTGGDVFSDFSDGADRAYFNTKPAILLSSSASIKAGGTSASITNTLVIRDGMTFPAINSNAYAGRALDDDDETSFSVEDCVIVGFDCCVFWEGLRPYGRRIYADGTGVTNAVIECATGNTDSGEIWEIKIQPLGTGNGVCGVSERPGTGFRMSGSGGPGAYIGDIVSQNFLTQNYEFLTTTHAGGTLWSDSLGLICGFGTSVGIHVGPGCGLLADCIRITPAQTGLLLRTNGSQCQVNKLTIGNIGGEAIQMGDATHSGNLIVEQLVIDGCVGHAVNVSHNNCTFSARQVMLANINGGVAPYFNSTVARPLQSHNDIFHIDTLYTDLAAGTNPFLAGAGGGAAGFYLGAGAAQMLRKMSLVSAVVGGTTGLGTGSLALRTGSDAIVGMIQLSPTGVPATANGQVVLTFPLFMATLPIVNCTLVDGSTFWPVTSTVSFKVVANNQIQIQWATNGAILTAGQTYNIAYQIEGW